MVKWERSEGGGGSVLSCVDFYQTGNIFNLKASKRLGIHIS